MKSSVKIGKGRQFFCELNAGIGEEICIFDEVLRVIDCLSIFYYYYYIVCLLLVLMMKWWIELNVNNFQIIGKVVLLSGLSISLKAQLQLLRLKILDDQRFVSKIEIINLFLVTYLKAFLPCFRNLMICFFFFIKKTPSWVRLLYLLLVGPEGEVAGGPGC